jgi:hypothetical protein
MNCQREAGSWVRTQKWGAGEGGTKGKKEINEHFLKIFSAHCIAKHYRCHLVWRTVGTRCVALWIQLDDEFIDCLLCKVRWFLERTSPKLSDTGF